MGKYSFLKGIISHFNGTTPSVAEATHCYDASHTLTVCSLIVDLDFRKRSLVSEVIGLYNPELASRIINASLNERNVLVYNEIVSGNISVEQAQELIDNGIVTSRCIPISSYSFFYEPFSQFSAEHSDDKMFNGPSDFTRRDLDGVFEKMSSDEGFTEQTAPYIPAEHEESQKRSR